MSERPAERHLSDEELSDLVDGSADAEVEDHAQVCASCASRLDGLRVVSQRLAGLRATSTPHPVRRDEAVAAALDAAPTPRAPGRYLKPLSGVAAAAAVIVAIGFGVAHAGHDQSEKTASNSGSPASSSGPAGRPQAAAPAVSTLGTLAGPSDVVSSVDRALSLSQSKSQLGGPATAGGSAAATANGAGAAPAVTCPDTDRIFGVQSARLLLSADAVYQGAPARVLVYQVGSGRRAVVLDSRTCTVLAQVSV